MRKTTFIYKRMELSKPSLFFKLNQTFKHRKMKMAIKKIYFRFNLKDNMEFYLKNTKKWPP